LLSGKNQSPGFCWGMFYFVWLILIAFVLKVADEIFWPSVYTFREIDSSCSVFDGGKKISVN
jgi:hypothetical protein